MRGKLRFVLIATALSGLLACSSGSGGGDDPGQQPPPPPPPPPDPASGLDVRPSNTTCLAPSRTTTPVTIGVERVFPNLTFDQPVGMLQAPGDSDQWFVFEKRGVIHAFENDEAVMQPREFLNIEDRVISQGGNDERGLLGVAFHPDWPTDRRVYVFYSGGSPLASFVSEFTSPDNGLTLDPNSERQLLRIVKPGGQTNHNGGNIAFGPEPEGFLYIGVGDGGGGNDQHGTTGNGQRLSTLHGKMLRIIVEPSGAQPYQIPAGNPFATTTELCGDDGEGTSGIQCPEIFAYGFRNPWRWSFDTVTGQLFVGDVGQGALEEIDRVTLGGNYGWRCKEGTRDTGLNCGTNGPFIDPIAEYDRSFGFSVTGGYVYRGTAAPALVGQYLFGDFGSGQIWHIPADTAPTLTVSASTPGIDTNLQISSFAQDHDGEVYVVNYAGTLHRITASGGTPGGGVAAQLSQTGCVLANNPSQPAAGLIPFAPNAPFWSDGATKERWIALPNGLNITVESDGDWTFPVGTVLMKHFRLNDRLIETRLFMRHPDDQQWAGYSYKWNSAGTDATLVAAGDQEVIDGQTWIFPSGQQCLQCHTEAAGFTLGPETRQLAFNITYPQTQRNAHQLVTLNAINVLSPPIADPTAEIVYPDPYGTEGTVEERARAYLHTNCAQCHRPNGPTPVNLDFRHATALADTNACDVMPTRGDLGIADARLIAPGDAARSIVVARMNTRDGNAMPPIASTVVDDAGVALLTSWIDSLTGCD